MADELMSLPPQVVLTLLREGHPDVTIESRESADLLDKLPYAHVRFGACQVVHPRLKLLVPVTIWSTVAGDQEAGERLAHDLYLTLWNAVQAQTTVPAGHITKLTTDSGPQESPLIGQPEGVIRFEGTYTLGIRPSPVTP